MKLGVELDPFLTGIRPTSYVTFKGRRKWDPRVQVRSRLSDDGHARAWSVQLIYVLHRYEITYFMSWELAIQQAFEIADYIRSKESA